MSRANSDRNLLFGVLALQMDFITREALIAAVSAWVVDKGRPLEDILVEQKALSASRRAMLEPLVLEHIKAHDGDPEKSLASVGTLGSVKDDLRQIADPEIAASIDRINVPETRDGDVSYSTRTPSVGTTSSSGLRFRILRPHDRGGLGIISVALDSELNREVALKEIQDRYADDPEKRDRFLLEAEVTGGLEHPGIVPVYGLGHHEDGRPFYAMRFIRGDSLQRAITRFHQAEAPGRDPGERSLQLRELLGRFVDVCDAIAYAHSRGVLHRDLKPGNIMLGKYGETLVVDWGLAKTSDDAGEVAASGESRLRPASTSGSAATIMGSAVGTPAYMSPEQAEGRLDRLGPASDVYSLGATLYHLIVGRVAFANPDVGLLLQDVIRGEFPPPRRASPSVPPALDAICLKAMAREPGGRYASPLELAKDIKDWLAGEPVSAYREPWTARAARWARRHKTPVAGAASLLLTALVAMAIGLILIRREQAETRTQRDLADRNFHKARQAADGFLARITDDPQLAQPELQALRRRLLEAGLSYYEGFAREGVDPGDYPRLADAFARVGRINDLIGSKDRALGNFREALTYREKAARSRPDDPEARRELAAVLVGLGNVELSTGRMAEALRSYERACELAEAIARERPNDVEAMRGLADALTSIGEWKNKSGARDDSIDYHRKAIALFEKVAAETPASRAKSDLARGLTSLGIVQAGARQFAEALRSLGRARELRDGLIREDPRNSQERNALAVATHWTAAIHYWQRRLDEALATFQRSRDLREELVAINTVFQYQDDLARDFDDMGTVHREAGRLDEALKAHQRAREIRVQLVRFHPEVPVARNRLSEGLVSIGQVHALAGRHAEALRSFEEGRKLLDDLVRDHPGEAEYRVQLARVCEHVGNLEGGVVKEDQILAMYERAREIREGLLREHPDDPEYLSWLSNSLSNIGLLKNSTGHLEEGMGLLRRARELRERVLILRPDDVENLSDLGAILQNLGEALEEANRLDEALDSYQGAVDRQKRALEKGPDAVQIREYLAMHYESVAEVQRKLGRPEEAASTALERLKLRPDDPAFLIQYARELALCMPRAGRDEAERHARSALDSIRRAIDGGFKDLQLLQDNPDLAPLRSRPEFDRLIEQVRLKLK